MQEYLTDGTRKNRLSKLISNARGKIYEMKSHEMEVWWHWLCGLWKRWKAGEEFVSYSGLVDENNIEDNIYILRITMKYI